MPDRNKPRATVYRWEAMSLRVLTSSISTAFLPFCCLSPARFFFIPTQESRTVQRKIFSQLAPDSNRHFLESDADFILVGPDYLAMSTHFAIPRKRKDDV